jgi:hypothetical protein
MAAKLRARNIGDFTCWNDPEQYKKGSNASPPSCTRANAIVSCQATSEHPRLPPNIPLPDAAEIAGSHPSHHKCSSSVPPGNRRSPRGTILFALVA